MTNTIPPTVAISEWLKWTEPFKYILNALLHKTKSPKVNRIKCKDLTGHMCRLLNLLLNLLFIFFSITEIFYNR